MSNVKPYREAIVQIVIDNNSVGTGVLVAHKYILTCSHLFIENTDNIKVVFNFLQDKPKYEAIISCQDEDIDVALLKIEKNYKYINYPLAEIEPENLTVEAFGYDIPEGRWIGATYRGENNKNWGQITFNNDNNVQYGFSGAPVWNISNSMVRIVGIVIASNPKNNQNAYILPVSEILKVEEIKEVIEKQSILKNPYKGLASFSKEDKKYYFGREKDISKIVNKILDNNSYNLFTILGISGVGKSSFLKAGIIPKFEDELGYKVVYTRPGNDPFYNLAFNLSKYLTSTKIDTALEIGKLEVSFKSRDEQYKNIIKTTAQLITDTSNTKLLLIIDQFEELFNNSKKEDIELFLEKLYPIIEAEDIKVKIIFSLRVDFLEKLLDYPKYFNKFEEKSRFFLGHLNEENLKRIIIEPAKLQGVSFDDGVVERILQEVKDEKGILPLLELYLTNLWDKQDNRIITNNILNQTGQVSDSIGSYAEDIYNQFDKVEQEAIKRIMIQTIFPGEGKEDTRQIAILDYFQEEDRDIITKLANKRLLVTGKDFEEKVTVEIIHEALISKWKRLKNWIDEYRPFRLWQNKLRVQMSDWKIKQDNSYLLRGRQLEEAVEYTEKYKFFIAKNELDFIQKSQDIEDALANKQKKRTKYIRIGLGMFIASLIGFLIYTTYQKNKILNLYDSVIKQYISFLVQSYRPHKVTYSPELLKEIILSLNSNSTKKEKIAKLLAEKGFRNTSKTPLLSINNVDFHVILVKLFEQDSKYISDNLDVLSTDAIWAWHENELEIFNLIVNNKKLVNIKLNGQAQYKINYITKLYNFIYEPNIKKLDILLQSNYFKKKIKDGNSTEIDGLSAILQYDSKISESLLFFENNNTKKLSGYTKYTTKELKNILDNRLKRIQKISNILYKHSQKNTKKYTTKELNEIENMYNIGIFELKSNKKMNTDYPFYKTLLPYNMKAKYLEAKKKKDLIGQSRWLEKILEIVPDNPWTLNELSKVVFEKKEENLKPYLTKNSNAPDIWKKALNFVLINQDLNKTLLLEDDGKLKDKIHYLYKQYGSFYGERKNYKKAILNYRLALKVKKEAEAYLGISWWYLFDKQYKKAITYGKKGLKLAKNNKHKMGLYTNIAHGYLLNNEYNKALDIYTRYKGKKIYESSNKLWNDIIIKDIKDLNEGNITSPYFNVIEKIMKDKNSTTNIHIKTIDSSSKKMSMTEYNRIGV